MDEVVRNYLIYRWLFVVLNLSLSATFTALAVMLLRLLLKKAPSWITSALWLAVLFRLLCPFSFSAPLSLLGSLGAPAAESGAVSYIPENIVHTASPAVNLVVPGVSEAVNETLPQGREQLAADPLEWAAAFMTLLWLLGLGGMLLYGGASYIRLKRRLREATLLEGNVLETDSIASPFVCGLIKPRIYLPAGLTGDERGYVLLHENAHIRRRDHLVKPLFFLALSIHWFNPIVWLCFRLMSRDMEMSCDERVIRELDGAGRAGYSATLMRLASGRPVLAGSPLAFGESGAKERIKHILRYQKPGFRIVVAAAVVCVAVAAFLLANPPSADETGRLRKDSPYINGLYLVTSEIKNDEAMAVFQNNLSYYDGWIRGDILITDNMPYQYSKDEDFHKELYDILGGKYSFTWRDGTAEHDLMGSGRSLRTGDDVPIAYGRAIEEYLPAGEEDVLVSIDITGFAEPLRFIVPAAGTAPEWGMLYGTFSPDEIVYLAPDMAVDAEKLLAADKGAVFTVLPEAFSVNCAAYQDVIGDVSYDKPYYSDGTALGETINVILRPGGDLASETISVSGYTSKYAYSVYDRNLYEGLDYYSVFLMDEETWIGRWRLYDDDSPAEIRCDYIFRVKSADAATSPASD